MGMRDLGLVLADIESRLLEASSDEEGVSESRDEFGFDSDLRAEFENLSAGISKFLVKFRKASNSSGIDPYGKRMAKDAIKDFRTAIARVDGVLVHLSEG